MAGAARTTWTNWAGTVRCEVTAAAPATVAELHEVVATAAARGIRVKAAGSGHSSSAVAATDGVQVRLDRLAGVVRADRDTGLVTVLAGTRLRELSAALSHLGLAISSPGDVDVQTISGAISTGTHGTGARYGGLATQVHALQLVRADGALVDVDSADPALFAAARVGLGALGVIATVTLRCERAFALAASEAPASLDAVLAELDALVDGNDHFEFCWVPHTRRVLAKRANRVLPGVALRPLRRVRRYVDDDLLANTAVEAVSRLTTRRPGLIPRANAVAARVLTARDYIDRSDRVFAVPRRVVFREMEYALARADVPAVLAEIADYLDRSGEQVGLPVHVRFAAADDIWLSPAQGRATGYIAVRQYHRRPHESYFQAVAAIARAVGGRPHWGKIHDQDADSLRAGYPHFDDFRAVRDRVDPTRVFGNDYLTRVLGP